MIKRVNQRTVLADKGRTHLIWSSMLLSSALLVGCNDGNQSPKQEIKPAQKMTNDASAVAKEAWILINQLDHALYDAEQQHLQNDPNFRNSLEDMVRKPLRDLSTRWRIEVKMTDSVTEGKYALCRKSLNTLDAWTRSVIQQSSDVAKRKSEYERDKALCKDAIDHPELGNTAP